MAIITPWNFSACIPVIIAARLPINMVFDSYGSTVNC